jgi:ABC-2 type transport system ATP-binding protein
MPEHEALVPGLTAVGFVAYMGRLCGMPKEEAIQRAHMTLQYVGLGEARYRLVETYSTGMKQRIKLAQALVHDPDLLLLDEPASGLDPKGRREMLELIRDVAFQKGISVILSSHLLPDVEFACDRVVVLNHGQIATTGKISDLKALHQRFFELRIKGDRKRFETALAETGLRSESLRDGKLRVLLGPDDKPGILFRAARESGVQIRHLAKQELTLQEIFERAINGVTGEPSTAPDSPHEERGS